MHDESGHHESGHDESGQAEQSHDEESHSEAVRSAAAFLVDAARGDVSTRTVVHVLRHWVSEGMTQTQLLEAVDVARGTAEPKYLPALTSFESAIRTGLPVE